MSGSSTLKFLSRTSHFFGLQKPSDDPPSSGIEIIGAGFGRTGTSSLQQALQILGFKTYHMIEVMKYNDHDKLAIQAYAGNKSAVKEWFQDMTRHGFRATLDSPTCTLYKEQMELYPDAKVILTLRDPHKWFKSFATIHNVATKVLGRPFSFLFPERVEFFLKSVYSPTSIYGSGYSNCVKKPKTYKGEADEDGIEFYESTYLPWIKYAKGSDETLDEENCVRYFDSHYSEVRKIVPKDKLLEMHISEGWEPLCKFLGLPVPDVEFPNGNSSNEMEMGQLLLSVINYTWPFIFAILLYVFWRIMKTFSRISRRIVSALKESPDKGKSKSE